MVYVLNKNGQYINPTNNHAKIRILLKSNKAIVVKRNPFTIKLLYPTKNYILKKYIRKGKIIMCNEKIIKNRQTKIKEYKTKRISVIKDMVDLLVTVVGRSVLIKNYRTIIFNSKYDIEEFEQFAEWCKGIVNTFTNNKENINITTFNIWEKTIKFSNGSEILFLERMPWEHILDHSNLNIYFNLEEINDDLFMHAHSLVMLTNSPIISEYTFDQSKY